MDWNREADREAARVEREMYDAHRGAYRWRVLGYSVIFGNDGHSPAVEGQPDGSRAGAAAANPSRAEEEVANVRRFLAGAGIEEMGFGLSDDHYSWAMIVRCPDSAALNQAVWEAWVEVVESRPGDVPPEFGWYLRYQMSIASTRLLDVPVPENSAN